MGCVRSLQYFRIELLVVTSPFLWSCQRGWRRKVWYCGWEVPSPGCFFWLLTKRSIPNPDQRRKHTTLECHATLECWQLTCQFPTWRSPIFCSYDRGNLMYEKQTWMLTIGLLNRNTGGWRTSEKVSWKKGQGPQSLQKWLLGVVRGRSRSFAMSPISGYMWFLIVVRSNDRAILYRYRNMEWCYVKNCKKFSNPPRII